MAAQRPGVARAALRPPALPAGVEAGNLGSGPAAGASDPPGGATNTLVVIIGVRGVSRTGGVFLSVSR